MMRFTSGLMWFEALALALALALAACGPTRLLGFCVYIRFFGGCRWRFRSYSDSLWQTPQRKQRSLAPAYGPRLGSGSFAP